MQKNIKFLMILTLIIYINNFAFAYINGETTLIDLGAIWSLSPYLLLTIASFILADDYKKEYRIVRKEARISYTLKLVACIIAFFNYKFEIGSLEYILRFVIISILFIVNIILEYKMYKMAKGTVFNKEEFEKVSEKDKWNIKEYGRAAALGVGSLMLFSIVAMNIISVTRMNQYYSVICIGVFIVFLIMNYKKNMLFYQDKAIGKRIFLKDAFYVTVGFGYNVIIAFNPSLFHEFYVNTAPIICACLLYPTITTTRKIGLKQRQVSKVIGDNFAYYYNSENNPYK